MKPYLHAKSSAQRFGGKPEEYLPIHEFMDSSKAHFADHRHRALFHSSFGCFIVEKVFGVIATNSEGKEYSPRDVAEQHIFEDLGKIPSVGDYLNCMTLEPWMGGPQFKVTKISFPKEAEMPSWPFPTAPPPIVIPFPPPADRSPEFID